MHDMCHGEWRWVCRIQTSIATGLLVIASLAPEATSAALAPAAEHRTLLFEVKSQPGADDGNEGDEGDEGNEVLYNTLHIPSNSTPLLPLSLTSYRFSAVCMFRFEFLQPFTSRRCRAPVPPNELLDVQMEYKAQTALRCV